MALVCADDNSLGPLVSFQCRNTFDFSLNFEDSVLGIIPQCLFIIPIIIQIWELSILRKTEFSKSRAVKAVRQLTEVCCVLFIAANVLTLVAAAIHLDRAYALAATSLELISSLSISIVIYRHHVVHNRPSHLVQFFFFVIILCWAFRLRTLFLIQVNSMLSVTASVRLGLALAILVLESLPGTMNASGPINDKSPDDYIGLFSVWFWWHINKLFQMGYYGTLTLESLPPLDGDQASSKVWQEFQDAWAIESKKHAKYAIHLSIYRVLKREMALPIFPKILEIAVTLSQPFLTLGLLNFLQDPNASVSTGYALLIGFALSFVLSAVFNSWFAYLDTRFNNQLRSGIISLIYETAFQRRQTEVGRVTTLLNVDVATLATALKVVHTLWSAVVSAAIGCYILYTQIGIVFLVPIGVIFVFSFASTFMGRNIARLTVIANEAAEKRITSLSNIPTSMKSIRMLGLERAVEERQNALRYDEVMKYRARHKLDVWTISMSLTQFQFVCLLTFLPFYAVALNGHGNFNISAIFASLSVLKLVTTPMIYALQDISSFFQGLASLKRINSYLVEGLAENSASLKSRTARSVFDSTGMEKRASLIMELRDASFGLDREKPALLRDINLKVQTGTLTLIQGEIGSGKSLLIRSLVGEMTLISGSAQFPESGIAYCDQPTWIRSASVRENIISEYDYDAAWYAQVVWACNLGPDLAGFELGDRTTIGSKGSTLSGGQKNRIALARALYARSRMLISDDVLAGLDQNTEGKVFKRVFGAEGLLRKHGVTVVMATHSERWQKQADQIIVMANLSIATAKAIDTFDVVEKAPSTERDSDSEPDEAGVPRNTCEKLMVEGFKIAETDDSTLSKVQSWKPNNSSEDWQSLVYYIKLMGVYHSVGYCVATIFVTGTTNAQWAWMSPWSEVPISNRSKSIEYMVIFTVISVISIILWFFYIGYIMIILVQETSLRLYREQLSALMRSTLTYLTTTKVGKIVTLFSQDVSYVDRELSMGVVNTCNLFCGCLITSILTVIPAPQLIPTLPALVLIVIVSHRIYVRTSRQIRRISLESTAPLVNHFTESISGLSTIRAFGWDGKYILKAQELLDAYTLPKYTILCAQNWLYVVLELMVAGLGVVVVGVAVSLRVHGGVNAGLVGIALVGLISLGSMISLFANSWANFESDLTALTRVREFSQLTPAERDSEAEESTEWWPEKGEVEFRSVTASWRADLDPALKDIDLHITAGEKVGVCGRTGSGKSSLVSTLFRLMDNVTGEIYIDGVQISNLKLDTLRTRLVAIPQDAYFLLDDTVRDNLCLVAEYPTKEPLNDENLRATLQKVKIWDRLASEADKGKSPLDLKMADVVESLSEGEKQLFSLARALLTHGRLVVLDEATSRMDLESVKLMHKILRELFAERTVIEIAHQLSMIMDFDKVIVMEAGRVAEVGVPRELMRNENSVFRKLVEAGESS